MDSGHWIAGDVFDFGGDMSKQKNEIPTQGTLRVWWIPQVPMNAFYVHVESEREAKKILNVLASYDLFQLENNIKPDFTNAGGLEIFANGDWEDWENEFGEGIDDVELDDLK